MPVAADVSYVSPLTSTFDAWHGSTIMYLTSEQDELINDVNHNKTMIRAPAGCGKTMLTNLKVNELAVSGKSSKIIQVNPYPQAIRSYNGAIDNNIATVFNKKNNPS